MKLQMGRQVLGAGPPNYNKCLVSLYLQYICKIEILDLCEGFGSLYSVFLNLSIVCLFYGCLGFNVMF